MCNLEIPLPSIAIGSTVPALLPPEPGILLPLGQPRPFLGRLKAALTCALLAAATGMAVQATLLLHEATRAARALPLVVSGELRATREGVLAQVAATRADLGAQITLARQDLFDRTERELAALRRDTVAQVVALRADAMGEVGQIRSTADRRVGDTLARVDTALVKVEELRGDLKPAIDHAASVTKQVDAAAPLFLDCEFNQDCFFNRYVGASRSIERAAMNFSQMSTDATAAMPAAIATWQGIGKNMAGITANVNQLTKPKWYDRLLGYGLNGVVIYRNLNPATNITLKAAQFVASRP